MCKAHQLLHHKKYIWFWHPALICFTWIASLFVFVFILLTIICMGDACRSFLIKYACLNPNERTDLSTCQLCLVLDTPCHC